MVKTNKRYEDARLKSIGRLATSGDLLDVGYAQMPNPYFEHVRCYGLDVMKPSRASGYYREIVGDAFNLSEALPGLKFDWIVAGEFIEHVRSPYDFLESLRAYLKPDGSLILSTPNPSGWPVICFEWARSERYFYTEDHLYYFTPRWVKRMLEFTGYRLIDTKSVGLWIPGMVLPCPVWLSYQVIYVARLA